MVSDIFFPAQNSPPSKKIMILDGSLGEMYKAAGEPSKHLAPVSILWRCLVYEAAKRVCIERIAISKVYMDTILFWVLLVMKDKFMISSKQLRHGGKLR